MPYPVKAVLSLLAASLLASCNHTPRVRLDVDHETEQTGNIVPLAVDCLAPNNVTVEIRQLRGGLGDNITVEAYCGSTKIVSVIKGVAQVGAPHGAMANGRQTTGEAGCKVIKNTGPTATFNASCTFD